MHLKITNGQPETYSIGQLRRDNPNTSFPKSPSDALLAGWGVYPYTVDDQPAFDYLTQNVQRLDITQVNGAWVQGWEVSNLPVEDAGRNIRSHRDSLLQQTDWMALSDVTMSPAWAAYRQALREMPEQAGYPYAVIWPTKPE
jgi:hypothetical protein